jgi:hypothetical protein
VSSAATNLLARTPVWYLHLRPGSISFALDKYDSISTSCTRSAARS